MKNLREVKLNDNITVKTVDMERDSKIGALAFNAQGERIATAYGQSEEEAIAKVQQVLAEEGGATLAKIMGMGQDDGITAEVARAANAMPEPTVVEVEHYEPETGKTWTEEVTLENKTAETKPVNVGDIVRVAPHAVHISMWDGAVHTPGKIAQHHGYHAVKVYAIFDDDTVEVEVGKFGDVDIVPLSACAVIEPLNEVMTPAEIEKEFSLATGTVRQAIRRGTFKLYRQPDERTYLIRRADAMARWGKRL